MKILWSPKAFFLRWNGVIRHSSCKSRRMARKAVKCGISCEEFLKTRSAEYREHCPQTDYLKLKNDVQVLPEAEIKKPIKAIIFPPWAADLLSWTQKTAEIFHGSQLFAKVISFLRPVNPIRAQKMAEQMTEAVESKEDTGKGIAEKEFDLAARIRDSDQAADESGHFWGQKMHAWWSNFSWTEPLSYVGIISMSAAEAILTLLAFSELIDTEAPGLKHYPRWFVESIPPALSVIATGALILLAHNVIQWTALIYNNAISRGRKTVIVVLILAAVSFQALISLGIGDLRTESLSNPLRQEISSSDRNEIVEATQILLVFLLPYIVGYLTYKVTGRKADSGLLEVQYSESNPADFPIIRNAEIKTLTKSIESLREKKRDAQRKIEELYSKAEKEIEKIKSTILWEEKILTAYLDEHYSALVADKFLFQSMQKKNRKK